MSLESQLHLYGGDALRVRPLVDGVWQLERCHALPARAYLEARDAQAVADSLLPLRLREGTQRLWMVSDTPEAVEWCLEHLVQQDPRLLGQIVEGWMSSHSLASDHERRKLIKTATGRYERSKRGLHDLGAQDYLQLLLLLAQRERPEIFQEPHQRLMRILSDGTNPFQAAERNWRTLKQRLDLYGSYSDGSQLYVGPKGDGPIALLDVVAPDLSWRLLAQQQPSGWTGMRVESPQRQKQDLEQPTPEHSSWQQFERLEQMLQWLEQEASRPLTGPLLDPRFAQGSYLDYQQQPLRSYFMGLYRLALPLGLSELEALEARYCPPLEQRENIGFKLVYSYDKRAVLLERARQEQLPAGYEQLEDEELRYLLAQAASRNHPLAGMLPRTAGFLRPTQLPLQTKQVKPTISRGQLESLVCHSLSGRYVHQGLGPQPTRLRHQIQPLELYRPANPFAD